MTWNIWSLSCSRNSPRASQTMLVSFVNEKLFENLLSPCCLLKLSFYSLLNIHLLFLMCLKELLIPINIFIPFLAVGCLRTSWKLQNMQLYSLGMQMYSVFTEYFRAIHLIFLKFLFVFLAWDAPASRTVQFGN